MKRFLILIFMYLTVYTIVDAQAVLPKARYNNRTTTDINSAFGWLTLDSITGALRVHLVNPNFVVFLDSGYSRQIQHQVVNFDSLGFPHWFNINNFPAIQSVENNNNDSLNAKLSRIDARLRDSIIAVINKILNIQGIVQDTAQTNNNALTKQAMGYTDYAEDSIWCGNIGSSIYSTDSIGPAYINLRTRLIAMKDSSTKTTVINFISCSVGDSTMGFELIAHNNATSITRYLFRIYRFAGTASGFANLVETPIVLQPHEFVFGPKDIAEGIKLQQLSQSKRSIFYNKIPYTMKYFILTLMLTFSLFSQERIINETTTEKINNNGTKTLSISAGERFYLSNSKFDTIDNRWVDSATYWVINKNKYNIRVKKNFLSSETFQFILPPNDLTFEADDLIIDSVTTLHPQNVTGYLKDSVTIRFGDCYRMGIHYEIQGINGFRCREIVDSNADLGDLYNPDQVEKTSKGDDYYKKDSIITNRSIEFKFKIIERNNKEKTVNIKGWDNISTLKKNKIDLGFEKYNIPEIKTDKATAKAEYKLEKKGGKRYISKLINVSDFRGIRTNLDFATTTGDGSLTSAGTSWAQAYGGANFVLNSYGTDMMCGSMTESNSSIYNVYLYFNTSAIGNNATITDATLTTQIKTAGSVNGGTMVLVSHTAPNPLAVTIAWPSTGLTSYGSVSTGTSISYTNKTITLNQSGLSAISKNDTTRFALVGNEFFTNTGCSPANCYPRWYVADNVSGTAAYLSITYSQPASIKNFPVHIINMHTP